MIGYHRLVLTGCWYMPACSAYMNGVLDPVVSPPIGINSRRRSGIYDGTDMHNLLGGNSNGNSGMMNNMARHGSGQASMHIRGFPSGERSCWQLISLNSSCHR